MRLANCEFLKLSSFRFFGKNFGETLAARPGDLATGLRGTPTPSALARVAPTRIGDTATIAQTLDHKARVDPRLSAYDCLLGKQEVMTRDPTMSKR